jgi:hypothetical protein
MKASMGRLGELQTSMAARSSQASRPVPRAAWPRHEAIAARAYDIWLRKGCPQGQSEANWFEAEAELLPPVDDAATPVTAASASHVTSEQHDHGEVPNTRPAGTDGGHQVRMVGRVTKDVGLWIDHRNAIIVTVTDGGLLTRVIASHLEGDTRPAAGWHTRSRRDSISEDRQDRRFMAHLDRFYGEVISYIHDAAAIMIFGPGEAKGELARRIEAKRLKGRIVAVEPADEMTTPQVVARVRQRFMTI